MQPIEDLVEEYKPQAVIFSAEEYESWEPGFLEMTLYLFYEEKLEPLELPKLKSGRKEFYVFARQHPKSDPAKSDLRVAREPSGQ